MTVLQQANFDMYCARTHALAAVFDNRFDDLEREYQSKPKDETYHRRMQALEDSYLDEHERLDNAYLQVMPGHC
jgi:hypothetical protein